MAVKFSFDNCECTNGHRLAPKSGSQFGVVSVPFGLLAGWCGAELLWRHGKVGLGRISGKWARRIVFIKSMASIINMILAIDFMILAIDSTLVLGHLGGSRVKKNGFCQYICPWRKLQFIVIL